MLKVKAWGGVDVDLMGVPMQALPKLVEWCVVVARSKTRTVEGTARGGVEETDTSEGCHK